MAEVYALKCDAMRAGNNNPKWSYQRTSAKLRQSYQINSNLVVDEPDINMDNFVSDGNTYLCFSTALYFPIIGVSDMLKYAVFILYRCPDFVYMNSP